MADKALDETNEHALLSLRSPKDWTRYRKLVDKLLRKSSKADKLTNLLKEGRTEEQKNTLISDFIDSTVTIIDGYNLWTPDHPKVTPATYWSLFHSDAVHRALAQREHGLSDDGRQQLIKDATAVWNGTSATCSVF